MIARIAYATGAIPEITYGIHESLFGHCAIGIVKGRVAALAFIAGKGDRVARAAIRATWPEAALVRDDAGTAAYAKKAFSGKSVSLLVRGTDFQIRVWHALLAIPAGKVATYAAVAAAAGSPGASRAVGSACARNGIAYLIPCHRVIAGNGSLGGYRWGAALKERLLAWEAAKGQSLT